MSQPVAFAGSISRLKDVAECPAYAYARHVTKLPELPETDTMAKVGRILHNCVTHRIRDGQWPDWSIDKEYEPGLQRELDYVRRNFERTIEALKIPSYASTEHRLAFNREWAPCDYFDPGTWFRLVFDVAWSDPDTGTVWIGDWKTGYVVNPEEDKEQVVAYALGAALTWEDARAFRVFLAYPRHGPEAVYWYDVDDEMMVRMRRTIDARLSEYNEIARREDKWRPKLSRRCARCPLWGKCPEIAKIRDEAVIPPADSEGLARYWLAAEALEGRAELLKKAAREVAKEIGPVIFPDSRVLTFHPTEKLEYPAREVLQWAIEKGAPQEKLYKLLDFGKTTMDDVMMAVPKIKGGPTKKSMREEADTRFARRSISTRFEAKRPKGSDKPAELAEGDADPTKAGAIEAAPIEPQPLLQGTLL